MGGALKMSLIGYAKQYQKFLFRVSVEFFIERLGVNPTPKEVSDFVMHISEIDYRYAKNKHYTSPC